MKKTITLSSVEREQFHKNEREASICPECKRLDGRVTLRETGMFPWSKTKRHYQCRSPQCGCYWYVEF